MSITLEGTSVKYMISTPSVFTINESNIDKLVSAAYTPTVTRNKTGSAATRYIVFSLAYGSSEWNIACWKAVFAANSKTATVTAYNTPFGPARMGDVANDTFNKLVSEAAVSGSTFSDNAADYQGGAIYNYAAMTVSDSVFTGNKVTDEETDPFKSKAFGGAPGPPADPDPSGAARAECRSLGTAVFRKCCP